MKRKLLVFSLIFSFIATTGIFVHLKATNEGSLKKECIDPNKSVVRILDEFDIFKSNGIVYKMDENYSYIVTSIDTNKNTKYKVLF